MTIDYAKWVKTRAGGVLMKNDKNFQVDHGKSMGTEQHQVFCRWWGGDRY